MLHYIKDYINQGYVKQGPAIRWVKQFFLSRLKNAFVHPKTNANIMQHQMQVFKEASSKSAGIVNWI